MSEMKTVNIPPRRAVEDQIVYPFINRSDLTFNFSVTATDDVQAKVAALDKIGYHVLHLGNNGFAVVDADDHDDVDLLISCDTFDQALSKTLDRIGWFMGEPETLIGGSLGAGFGEANE
jgi:hypothetical protein